MKILLFANTFGYFKSRKNLIKFLLDKKFEVYVCADVDKFESYLEEIGCKILKFKIDKKGKNFFKELILLLKIFVTFKKVKPSLILNFTIKPVIYSSIASSFLNISHINTMTGIGIYFFKKNLFNYFFKFLFSFSQKNVNKIFFQNEENKRFILSQIARRNIVSEVIPGSGVDIENYKSTFYPDEKIVNFLYFGRLLWDKGIGELIEAIKILKQKNLIFKVTLVGPYDSENIMAIGKKKLEEWVEKNYVTHFNYQENIKLYIEQAHCVVLPSYMEGLPRSLMESAAMSRPIITTNTVGCKEVVQNKINGFLCNVKDSKDLAKKMADFINLNLSEKIKMGSEGRKIAEKKFNEKIVINKYFDAIESIIQK